MHLLDQHLCILRIKILLTVNTLLIQVCPSFFGRTAADTLCIKDRERP